MPRRRRMSTSITNYATLSSSSASILENKRCSPGLDRHLFEPQDSQDCQVSSTTSNLMREVQNIPLVNTLQMQHHDSELDADKKTIVNHPLYPLLAILLQQCELASARPDSPPPLDAFDDELRTFIQRRVDPHEGESLKTEKAKNHKDTGSSSEHSGRQTRGGQNRYKQSAEMKSSALFSKDGNIEKRDKRMIDTMDYGTDATQTTQRLLQQTAEIECTRPLTVFGNDHELNELIVKAIQVLRIHLLELHKVNELCKDFCSRYIYSLKTKFQNDPMIQDSQPSSPGDPEVPSPAPPGCYGPRYFAGATPGVPPFGYPVPGDLLSQDYRRRQLGGLDDERFRSLGGTTSDLSPSRSTYSLPNEMANGHGYGSEVDGMCYTPNCQLLDYGNASQFSSKDSNGEDPFEHLHPFLSPYAMNSAAFHARLDNLCVGGKQKRGVLPKRATQIMKQWLFQHLVHPYPTEDEKRQIAGQTNLTLLQVNNWFINARRRILQPMLDASNFIPLGNHYSHSDGGRPDSNSNEGLTEGTHVINKKKKAATSRPSNNRFWPASLVAAAALHPVAAGLVSSGTSTNGTHASQVYTNSTSVRTSVSDSTHPPCSVESSNGSGDGKVAEWPGSHKRSRTEEAITTRSSLPTRNDRSYTPNDRLSNDDAWNYKAMTGSDVTRLPSPVFHSNVPEQGTNRQTSEIERDEMNRRKNPPDNKEKYPYGPDHMCTEINKEDRKESSSVDKITQPVYPTTSRPPVLTSPPYIGREPYTFNTCVQATQDGCFPPKADNYCSTSNNSSFGTKTGTCLSERSGQPYGELVGNHGYPYCSTDNEAQYKFSSFPPSDYSSVLLNHAQQYTNYLASGMGLTNPFGSTTDHMNPNGSDMNSLFPNIPSFYNPTNLIGPNNVRSNLSADPESWPSNSYPGEAIRSMTGDFSADRLKARTINHQKMPDYSMVNHSKLFNDPNPMTNYSNLNSFVNSNNNDQFNNKEQSTLDYSRSVLGTNELIHPKSAYPNLCDYPKLSHILSDSRPTYGISHAYQSSTQTLAP